MYIREFYQEVINALEQCVHPIALCFHRTAEITARERQLRTETVITEV